MARKRFSAFYHTRWHTVGINETIAANVLGVTVEDVKRFDLEGAPAMAERLLLLWDKKNVGFQGWENWLFSRGVLIHKRQQFTPETILNDRKFRIDLEKESQALLRNFKGTK